MNANILGSDTGEGKEQQGKEHPVKSRTGAGDLPRRQSSRDSWKARVGLPLVVAGALLVAACGTPTPDTIVSPQDNPSSAASMTQSAPSEADRDGDSTAAAGDDSDTPASTNAGSDDAVTSATVPTDSADRPLAGLTVSPEQAAEIALGEVADARVAEIELDSVRGVTVWEVELVTTSAAREVAVDAVTGDVVANKAKDSDDVAEHNQWLDAASVDYADALRIATDSKPGSQATQLELDDDDEAVVWEVDLLTPEHEKYQVEIDARSGKITDTDRDD